MASKTNVSYKAQFCREYFYQLKGFIENFSLNKNNLGMEFLLEVYNDVPERKKYCRWDNTVKVEEKDLMLAIEEFYSITQASETLQEQRERIFKGLMDPNKLATDDMLKSVLVDQQTMQAILYYFGVSGIRKVSNKKKESQDIEDLIQGFKLFANDAAYTRSESKNFNIFFYSQALHLFQQLRNDPAHKLFKKSVPQRKIAFQYVAFMYIGLTYLLRQTWKLRENTLGKHTKTDSFLNFSMPSQPMKIAIATDDENDRIFGYEFTPDISNPSQRVVENIDPTNRVDNLEVSVRKYQSFKLSVTYGKPDDFKTVTFGEDGDKMLIYYYWTPTFEIHLPKVSELKPGLTNTGSADIDDKVAKLFENANKQQDFAIRSAMIKAANDFMNSLAPRLDEIKKLNENAITLSEQQEVHRRQLIEKVNQSLSTQLSKNEEYLRNILSNTKTALEEINGLKEHVKALNETQSDNQKEIWERLDQIAEAQKHLNIEAQNLYSSSYHDLDLKNPHKLKSDKTSFWLKHIPAFIILIFAFGVLIRSISNDYSLFFLEHKLMSYSIPVLLTVISFFSIWVAYNTTVSNRSAIIKPFTRYIGWGLPILTGLFFLFAIIAIPNKTIQSLAANYDFFTAHNEEDNALVAKLMEKYLDIENPTDDESIRVKLAHYYLNYTGEREKALDITRPMMSDMKKYKDGVLSYAEALYDNADYSSVKTIIRDYKKVFNDSTPITERLEGIMMCKKQGGYLRDIFAGEEKLNNAVNAGDIEAKYLFGFLLTNDATEWAPRADKDGKIHLEIADMNLIHGIFLLQEAALVLPKASLELGNIYADFNMIDSAMYYYNKVIDMSIKGKKMYYQAVFKRALLRERKGDVDNPDLRMLILEKYKPAILHDAIKEKNAEVIISILDSVEYEGYKYISPKVLAYISLGQKEEALNTLKSTYKDGGFNMTFVNGIEKLLGSKYVDRDSLDGMKLLQSISDSCDYARMICLYREYEKKILNGEIIHSSEIEKLDNLGERIPLAYVLSSYILRNTGMYTFAEWAAIKATSKGHPAGALGLTSTCRYGSKEYFEGIWKNEHECNQFLHFMQVALRKSPDKQICIHYGYNTDDALYILQNKKYPIQNLRFWTDIAIANNYTSFEYFLLNLWSQCDKSWFTTKEYRNKLVRSILGKINLKERGMVYREQLDVLASAINDMSDKEIDSLKKDYIGKVYALMMIDSRKHIEPLKYIPISTVCLDMTYPMRIEDILSEFSDVTEGDKYKKYFQTTN